MTAVNEIYSCFHAHSIRNEAKKNLHLKTFSSLNLLVSNLFVRISFHSYAINCFHNGLTFTRKYFHTCRLSRTSQHNFEKKSKIETKAKRYLCLKKGIERSFPVRQNDWSSICSFQVRKIAIFAFAIFFLATFAVLFSFWNEWNSDRCCRRSENKRKSECSMNWRNEANNRQL